jgi:hypothetical protein
MKLKMPVKQIDIFKENITLSSCGCGFADKNLNLSFINYSSKNNELMIRFYNCGS